jgi:HSP20 family protein
MSNSLIPRSFLDAPGFIRMPSIWDDFDDMFTKSSSGLSISEDDKNIYIEAPVPGVNPEDVEVTFDKGTLWVKAESKQEETNKKYYRRAANSFSYRIAVPGEIDPQSEPQATYKNGVMKVAFTKVPEVQPKRLTVKAE